jgi:hypothetical protein
MSARKELRERAAGLTEAGLRSQLSMLEANAREADRTAAYWERRQGEPGANVSVEGARRDAADWRSEARALREAWHEAHGEPAAATGQGAAVEAKLTRMSEVTPKPLRWLWPERIPLGKLSFLEGHPGLGKGHVTVDLAAAVSRGGPFPDGGSAPRGVAVFLMAEDGLADALRPRLDAAGADCARVLVLEGLRLRPDEAFQAPTIPDDVPLLREQLAAIAGLQLVVIDPMSEYLSGKVNAYKDHEVRRALAPLKQMAEDLDIAVLMVRHLRKATGGDAVTAGGGSIAFTALARTTLLVTQDPEDPERRVLAVAKNNLARKAASITFRLSPVGDGKIARVAWEGVSRFDANGLLAALAERDDGERSKVEEAADWLREYLREGEAGVDATRQAARKAGISDRTLDRARTQIGVTWNRIGFGKGASYVYRLPHARHAPPCSPYITEVGEHGGWTGANSLNDNGSTSSPTPGEHDGEHGAAA